MYFVLSVLVHGWLSGPLHAKYSIPLVEITIA